MNLHFLVAGCLYFGLVIGVDRSGIGAALRAAGADVVVADLSELSLRWRDDWTIARTEPLDDEAERAHDALFTMADGSVGVHGDIEDGDPGRSWLTLAAGAIFVMGLCMALLLVLQAVAELRGAEVPQ